MNTAIQINGLSKIYNRVGAGSSYATLRENLAALFQKKQSRREPFAALKDVNLTINQGERIGIVGRNGAGKSTLLKIISQITPPSSGEVEIFGRVASLLEVGTGFHPELTGYENIFLNGSILGLKKKEIQSRLDEIIAFSGVEKFIYTPLKHYSSGMQLRLAFSVAAHLEADILLVDEVLSVGDAEFQKKCFGKMKEMGSNDERTIVLVSHDLEALSKLTTSCVLLQQGEVIAKGETQKVIQRYLQQSAENPLPVAKNLTKPHFNHFAIQTSLGGQLQAFNERLEVLVGFLLPEPVDVLELSFQICSDVNAEPIVYNWFSTAQELSWLKGRSGQQRLRLSLPALRLYKGDYFFRFYLSDPRGKTIYQTVESVLPFQVQMHRMSNEWGWQNNVCKYIEQCTISAEQP